MAGNREGSGEVEEGERNGGEGALNSPGLLLARSKTCNM